MGFRRAWIACLLVVLGSAGVAADARSDAIAQVEFGITVARRNLWNEARYRWERAVAIDPTYAPAYNNLAVAYERTGDFDKAREAYERALEIDPNNLIIQQNFDLFREINDRSSTSSAR